MSGADVVWLGHKLPELLVWRGDYRVEAEGREPAEHGAGGLEVPGAVVEGGEDVTVKIDKAHGALETYQRQGRGGKARWPSRPGGGGESGLATGRQSG